MSIRLDITVRHVLSWVELHFTDWRWHFYWTKADYGFWIGPLWVGVCW